MRARPDRWLPGVALAAALGVSVAILPAWRIEAALARKAEAALTALPDGASWATAVLSGRDATLSGEAPSPDARRAALAALGAVPGIRRTVDRTTDPSSPVPLAWSASRQGDRFILAGTLPPGPARDDLLRRAQALLPVLRIEDRAIPSRGEPAGFTEAATLALHLLEYLDPGTVTVEDGAVTVEGAAATSVDFEAARAALARRPASLALRSVAILPPFVAPFTWSARRAGEEIRVSGHAPSPEARERVATAARRLHSGSRLAVDLNVARGLRPGLDYEAATELLLAQLAALGDSEVGFTDDALRVVGATPDKDGAARAATALETATRAGFRLGDVRLSAVRPQPYRFQARRAPGRLLLAGHLPDEAARDSVRSLVRRRFFAEAVDDQLRLADGAPAGFVAGASAGLEQLSRLAEGEATLGETALVLSGEALYEQTAERMPADLRAALPPGFTAQAAIRVRRESGRREVGQP